MMDLLVWIHGYTEPLVHSVDCATEAEVLAKAFEIGNSGFSARGSGGFIYFSPTLIARIEYHAKALAAGKEDGRK